MKKSILIFAFAAICFGAQAKGIFNIKKSSHTEKKKEPIKKENCGTATNGIYSDCWSAEVTVTYCCDCEPGVAFMVASMTAQSKAKDLQSIVEFLNATFPCDSEA